MSQEMSSDAILIKEHLQGSSTAMSQLCSLRSAVYFVNRDALR